MCMCFIYIYIYIQICIHIYIYIYIYNTSINTNYRKQQKLQKKTNYVKQNKKDNIGIIQNVHKQNKSTVLKKVVRLKQTNAVLEPQRQM